MEVCVCGIFDVPECLEFPALTVSVLYASSTEGRDEAVTISNFDNGGGNTNINRCSMKKRFQRWS